MSQAKLIPLFPSAADPKDRVLAFDGFLPSVQIDVRLHAAHYPFSDDRVCFDSGGHMYHLGGGNVAGAVLWSDMRGTYRAYTISDTYHARIEFNDRPEERHDPPALLLMGEEGRLRLILPDWMYEDPADWWSIDVSADSLLRPAHSGVGNSVLSHGRYVFVAYPSRTPPADGRGTTQYLTIVDRQDRKIIRTVLLGKSDGRTAADAHDIPALTMDSKGTLHVLLGAHHAPLQHVYSTSSDWSTFSEPEPIGATPSEPGYGHTYVGLVCDAEDRLHVVTRWSGWYYRFRLVYNRREADGTWSEQRDLVHPGRSMYMGWYHRLSRITDAEGRETLVVESPGAFWGQLSEAEVAAYKRMWPGEKLTSAAKPDGSERHRGFTLLSDDGGDSWMSKVYGDAPVIFIDAVSGVGLSDEAAAAVRDELQKMANRGLPGALLNASEIPDGSTLDISYTIDGEKVTTSAAKGAYLCFFGDELGARTIEIVEATLVSMRPTCEESFDLKEKVEELVAAGHARFRVRWEHLNIDWSRHIPRALTVKYRVTTIVGGEEKISVKTTSVGEHEWFVF